MKTPSIFYLHAVAIDEIPGKREIRQTRHPKTVKFRTTAGDEV